VSNYSLFYFLLKASISCWWAHMSFQCTWSFELFSRDCYDKTCRWHVPQLEHLC